MKNKSRLLTLLAGLLLIIPAWVGSFATGYPTLRSPLPLLMVIPIFTVVEALSPKLLPIMALLPALLFFLWNPSLLKGVAQIPTRSVVVLVLSTGLMIPYFALNWHDGIKYQGIQYTQAIFVMNGLWWLLLCLLFIKSLRRPSFAGNLVFHWILFAWLSWYAFPWLGELP